MSTKHRTKIVAIPTKVITTPILECSEEELKKLPKHWPNTGRNRWGSTSSGEAHYTAFFKDETEKCYFTFAFPVSQLHKKNKKKIYGIYSTRKSGGGFYSTGKGSIESSELIFVWLENKMGRIYDSDKIIDYYQDYIGTDKTLYADLVISKGMDFRHETAYKQQVIQPKLGNKHIELRKKFADDPKITFYFDKKNTQLFRDVQKLLIEKYKAVGERKMKSDKNGRLDYDGYKPWKLQEEYPVSHHSHLKEPIVYTYLYIDNTVEWFNKKGQIQVISGDDDDREFHRKELGITVKSIEEIDSFLSDYDKYVRLVRPKQHLL